MNSTPENSTRALRGICCFGTSASLQVEQIAEILRLTPSANPNISMISTREFVIDDYDAAVALWNLAEGVEVAEGDSREEIRAYLLRNPGLSGVAEENGTIVGAV